VRRSSSVLVAAALLGAGCGLLPPEVPRGAYYPPPGAPTTVVAEVLYRAAEAAGDDPTRYSFALVESPHIFARPAPDGIIYVSDGLVAQPRPHLEALLAQAVAHEVLGHQGQRRRLSLGITAGFAVLGVLVPGLGLADLVVNPVVVRAFSREQHLAADRRAVELLRAMGHRRPRRVLASALEAAGRPFRGTPGWLADEPDLETRLAALEPLEPAGVSARGQCPEGAEDGRRPLTGDERAPEPGRGTECRALPTSG
jgi:Zn-dependent protease with chaperone function